jgi:hypothetical protein
VEPPGSWGDWRRLAVAAPGGATFTGLWRVREGRVWTIVADRPFRIA